MLVTRHFSLISPKLLDIGYFDNLVEINAPTKEQRYAVIKNFIAPIIDLKSNASIQNQEVKLQAMC